MCIFYSIRQQKSVSKSRANTANRRWRAIEFRQSVHFDLLWLILIYCGLLVACTGPQQLLDTQAEHHGFERLLLIGAGYRHIGYSNRADGAVLHVYLEGDGSPWLNRHTIARDPTPRRPLMLRLMAYDPRASLYLGRPCYHGLHAEPGCSPLLWTARRYGPEVVDSMARALENYLTVNPHAELVFIGHSGGGTLAWLLAERFPQTRTILTLAGNLDIDAWTRQHGYTPLQGSINPAERPPLPATVGQLHLVGAEDTNIAPELIQGFITRQPCAELRILSNHDHFCCWAERWPEWLRRLENLSGCDA